MYSGLLPKGLTEDDLSDDEQEEAVEEERTMEKCESSVIRDAPLTHTVSGSPTSSLPGVSQEMWQKFQDLRKKSDEMKTMKVQRKRKRRRHKKAGTESAEPTETRVCQEERQQHWDGLKQYFGVNDRFDPPACSNPHPKSGLETSIEKAIAEGDIAKAEEMSDRLATRELAVKIAQAADCRDFVEHKQEEEALKAAQKRKKDIVWGFEAKQRWESKSNMGFM
ncbi:protein FAM204A isoform X2 [Platichthys flesus]|uniref:protein FAM204A isoform X2 n=1 Tax=Platichthys flesus TaxID=8260 RepID=UPI001A83F1F3|nr:protein FAM204A isoform X2 [Platichthys flesus]